MKILKAWSIASRGRYEKDHGNDDSKKHKSVQKMELRKEQGISNTITTVHTDTMVVILTEDTCNEVKDNG